jgi:hypothetical protein
MEEASSKGKPYKSMSRNDDAGNLADSLSEEPRWPAAIALLALGGLYSALPSALLVGGHRWLLLIAVSLLLVPTVIAHVKGNHFINEVLGMILNSMVTLAMVWSLVQLIDVLPEHEIAPRDLLLSAGALWIGNILVFASWYWRLDAGGPHGRDLMPGHTDGAFLFPQMTMSPELKAAAGEADWSPNFIDYLFLAFNTSTAFSPTDTAPLSRWAKILMITQSLISLLVIALLAGRAVNIL